MSSSSSNKSFLDSGIFSFDGKFNIVTFPRNTVVYHGSPSLVYNNREMPLGNDYYNPSKIPLRDVNINLSYFGDIGIAKTLSSKETKVDQNKILKCMDKCVLSFKTILETKFINLYDKTNIQVLLKDEYLLEPEYRYLLAIACGMDMNIQLSEIEYVLLINKNGNDSKSSLIRQKMNDELKKFSIDTSIPSFGVFMFKSLGYSDILYSKYINHYTLPQRIINMCENMGYSGYIQLTTPNDTGGWNFGKMVFGRNLKKYLKRDYSNPNDWQYNNGNIYGSIGRLIKDMKLYKTTNSDFHSGNVYEHSVWCALNTQNLIQNNSPWVEGIKKENFKLTIASSFLHDIGKTGDNVFLFYDKFSHPADGALFLSGERVYKEYDGIGIIDIVEVLKEMGIGSPHQIKMIGCLIRGHYLFGDVLMTNMEQVLSEKEKDRMSKKYIKEIINVITKEKLTFENLQWLQEFIAIQILISICDVLSTNSFTDKTMILSGGDKINVSLVDFPFITNVSQNYRGHPSGNAFINYKYDTKGFQLREYILREYILKMYEEDKQLFEGIVSK